jgi:hypothetical protein
VLKNQEYPIMRANTARPASTRRTAGPAQARWSRSTTRVVSAEFIAPVINYDAKLQA